jgi:predicted porin
MKKHLIAAAVAGAFVVPAMAQVTVSGQFGIGYGKGLTTSQGMQITDGNITFSAAEDLGGGMKAAAGLEVRVRGRGASNTTGQSAAVASSVASVNDIGIGGRNATVSLSGGFGTISGGAIEFANGIFARGSAGAPVALQNPINEDGLVLSTQANSEFLRYDSPAIVPGLTLAAVYADATSTAGRGADTVAAKNTYSLTGGVFYRTGPIDAAYEYTSFNQADGTTRIRHRTSASYDLGVARIGAGYETRERTTNKNLDYSEYVFGISVPLGATTVGLTYLANQDSDNSLMGIGVQYALSKRTSLNFSYADKDGVAPHPLATAATAEGTQYRVRLLHSF